MQHLAGPDRRKLVDVADDQESGRIRHCLHERLHQHDVHGMLGKRRAYGITFEGMGNSVQLALNQRVPGSSPGAPTTQPLQTALFGDDAK
jgi:hypothetical protein